MEENTKYIFVLLLLLLISVVFMFRFSDKKDALKGTWNLDGTTVYQFDGNGEGAMILPGNTYSFMYTINEDEKTVSIDFQDENAADDTYSYEVEKDSLTLYGNVGQEKYEYKFIKQNHE